MPSVRCGQRWEVIEPLDAIGLTSWRAPFTGGFGCTVPVRVVLTVEHDPNRNASAVSCIPEDYEHVEAMVVPEEDRTAEKYDGYRLVIDLESFTHSLRLLDD